MSTPWTIIGDEDGPDGFMPVSFVVGNFVYIQQGEEDRDQITMTREVAQRLSDELAIALASAKERQP